MNCVRVFLLVFLMVFVGRLSAGEPAADFSISANMVPGGIMPPGTEGVLTITVTNQGPDTGTPFFSMVPTDDGSDLLNFPPLHFQFPGALLAGPCVTPPVQLPPDGEFLSWIIPDMAPGESVACTYAFTVAETSIVSQVGRWTVRPFSGANDPNAANNIADVLLLFAEPPGPVVVATLSPWALLVLALVLGLTALGSVTGHRP